MGQSASAQIAYGVNLMEDKYFEELHPSIQHLKEEKTGKYGDSTFARLSDYMDGGLHEVFGLPYPPDIMKDVDSWREWKKIYQETVPVEIRRMAGYWDFPAYVLVISRSFQSADDYELEEVDTEKLVYPSSEEVTALFKVLDFMKFNGDRRIRLLFGADYG